MSHSRTVTLGDQEIHLETGDLARQALASVVVRQGKTVVLVSVVAGPCASPQDFFPLTVEYREKLSSVGRIPGGFGRREGRITDPEVLGARLIDRSIRPLFEGTSRDEVQVYATVMSADPAAEDPAILALLGTGAALELSPLPWNGPAAGLRVVGHGGTFRVLPSAEARANADLDLIVSAGPEGVTMLEGTAQEGDEQALLAAVHHAREALKPWWSALASLKEELGIQAPPAARGGPTPEVESAVEEAIAASIQEACRTQGKMQRTRCLEVARDKAAEVLAHMGSKWPASVLVQRAFRGAMRELLSSQGRRLDGRGAKDLRSIDANVGWLPVPHGSAVFTRGCTQAAVSCTLASQNSELALETLNGMERRPLMLHYNFPSYSVGEIGPSRGPGRREIGHGYLALRALEPVLPPYAAFPYVIRLESDILESDGSSSMATVCGATLALWDAGVPIASPVAGIAMGMVANGSERIVLSDILGDEDMLGDLDLKVAGTRQGITALQLDTKRDLLSAEALEDVLRQAKDGRLAVLERLSTLLAAPRSARAKSAPRSETVQIESHSVGLLIGPKGATIRSLQDELGVEITVTDKGLVTVFAHDETATSEAISRVRNLVGVVEVEKIYEATIVSVKDFGAIVRVFDTAEGLVHVTEWGTEGIESMPRTIAPGEKVVVRVQGVDSRGRLKLSRKAAMESGGEPTASAATE